MSPIAWLRCCTFAGSHSHELVFLASSMTWASLKEMVVDETYKKNEGDEITYYWVNEVWEGYQIDKDIYVSINLTLCSAMR